MPGARPMSYYFVFDPLLIDLQYIRTSLSIFVCLGVSPRVMDYVFDTASDRDVLLSAPLLYPVA